MNNNRIMKKLLLKYVMVLSILSFCFSCSGQQKKQETKECNKCDIKTVLKTSEKISQLTEGDIACFLLGFGDTCSNNVEYSEFSNEVLFKVVAKYPKEFLDVFSRDLINQGYILKELSTPLLDFNLEEIVGGVKSIREESEIKGRILNSLQKAIENQ